MADEPTSDPLNDALQQAHAEIDALRAVASESDTVSDELSASALVYEVEGIGRYVIPYADGWRPLLAMVQDPALNLRFSPLDHPGFDKIATDTLHRAARGDVLPELRDNLAAVRNFLMQVYYDTDTGMTADQAAHALQEIAAFVGDGLSNNPRAHGLLFPDTSRAYIDAVQAALPGGDGAQYIYERILESNRQSNWVRPFSAIVALFGGKANSDWLLPPANATPFHHFYDTALVPEELATVEEIDAAMAHLDTLEARHAAQLEEMDIAATAADLDAMGNHLLHTAEALNDVRQMSEPVRQDAIEIAKDILRKLKISIGELNVLDGLGLKPRDNLNDVGGIKAVAMVYERLLAWGRGIDPTIMQHPSILAATRAIGQIGVIAKTEALRLAMMSSNLALANTLKQQLGNIPGAYTKAGADKMSGLLDHVERGIDTVLNRVVTITGPGAAVGHSRSNELGSYMGGTPIAGTALQTGADGVGKSSAQQQQAIQEGQQDVQRAQMQRAQQAANQQARANSNAPSGQQRSGGGASAQLAAMRQRLAQARRSATTQQQNMQGVRSNTNRQGMIGQQQHDDHHHDHHHPTADQMAATLAKLDPRVLNNIKQMNTTTAGLTNNPVVTGRAAFDKMRTANSYGLKPSATPPKTMTEEEKKKQQALNPPPPPKKDGRGI